jgi:hypothetical protein
MNGLFDQIDSMMQIVLANWMNAKYHDYAECELTTFK